MNVSQQLSIPTVRSALATHGWAQADPFLASDDAARIETELDELKDWDFAVTSAKGPVVIEAAELKTMSPAQRGNMLETLRRQARSGYSMAYYRRDVQPAEHGVAAEYAHWVQSKTFIELMRELTGDPSITRADAHASLYQAGSYLRSHDDTYAGKSRRFAYVLNLTRAWTPDCGGLLQFEQDEQIVASLVPKFNTLNLFRVPRSHFVSQVASYATAKRLAITGWLFAD